MKENAVYHLWWLHDARWYQEVASEFGFEVANRLNKKILIFIAKRVARQLLLKKRKSIKEMSFEEVIDLFMQTAKVMWPEELVAFEHQITSEDTFEVHTKRNFALFMLEQAGSLDQYDCPCLELRQGWFEGLGIEVFENKMIQCVREGGKCCTFRACIKQKENADKCHVNP
jgi:hypothetical protein